MGMDSAVAALLGVVGGWALVMIVQWLVRRRRA